MLEYIITLSLLIALVLLIRGIFRKNVSPRVIYAMWLMVVVRMCLPVSLFTVEAELPSFLKGMETAETLPLEEEPKKEITNQPIYNTPFETSPDVNLAEPVGTSPNTSFVTPETVANAPTAPIEPRPDTPVVPDVPSQINPVTETPSTAVPVEKEPVNWTRILNTVWFVGAGFMAGWFASTSLVFHCRLWRDRRHVATIGRTKVYISENVAAPCLAGVIPSIYITPEAADNSSRQLIIVHEYVHLKHGDHVWSILRVAALIVFWWNPLVWAAAFVSKQDCELACDDTVASKLNEDKRFEYAHLLLDTIPRKHRFAGCLSPLNGLGSEPMKERILMLTTKQKNNVLCVILALALTLSAVGCSFMNVTPKTDGTEENETNIPEVDETKSPETDAPDVIADFIDDAEREEVNALFERANLYRRVHLEPTELLPSGKLEEYNKVTDERFDEWNEWIAFLESIFTGDKLENVKAENDNIFINIDGNTYVTTFAGTDLLSNDYSISVAGRSSDILSIELNRTELRPGYTERVKKTWIYQLTMTDAGWRISNITEIYPTDFVDEAERETVNALFERMLQYEKIHLNPINLMSGQIQEYNKVTDERFDEWAEWTAYLESIFVGNTLDWIKSAGETRFVNRNGETYVKGCSMTNQLSTDFSVSVYERRSHYVMIVELKRTQFDGTERIWHCTLSKTQTGWRIADVAEPWDGVLEYTLPDGFAEIYHEAEAVYGLFTVYPLGRVYGEGTITYDGQKYQKTAIDGVTSLAELRILCEQYFDKGLTDELMSKTVLWDPLYIEQDGILYRFGAYVSQYGVEAVNYQMTPVSESSSGQTVRISAEWSIDQYDVTAEVFCSYTVTENGQLRFTSFAPIQPELVLTFEQTARESARIEAIGTTELPTERCTFAIEPSEGEVVLRAAAYGEILPYGGGWYGIEGLVGDCTAAECEAGYEDGTGYVTFGVGTYENRNASFRDYHTYRVTVKDKKIVDVVKVNNITRETVLRYGVPHMGSLDGEHFSERASYISGQLYGYKVTISGNNIKYISGMAYSGAGTVEEGTFTYDRETGVFEAVFVDEHYAEGGESTGREPRTVSGKLLSYNGFLHFVVDDPEKKIPDDSFPLTFVIPTNAY